MQFLSTKAVVQRTTLTRSTLHRKVRSGEFPKPIQISDARVAWTEDSVESWMRAQIERAA